MTIDYLKVGMLVALFLILAVLLLVAFWHRSNVFKIVGVLAVLIFGTLIVHDHLTSALNVVAEHERLEQEVRSFLSGRIHLRSMLLSEQSDQRVLMYTHPAFDGSALLYTSFAVHDGPELRFLAVPSNRVRITYNDWLERPTVMFDLHSTEENRASNATDMQSMIDALVIEAHVQCHPDDCLTAVWPGILR
ncbi:MAG: hypothetical protein V1738_04450 [Patescibacteria group bacterium]